MTAKNSDEIKPINICTLSEEQLNAELEKGYNDMLEGRVKAASDVFEKIRDNMQRYDSI